MISCKVERAGICFQSSQLFSSAVEPSRFCSDDFLWTEKRKNKKRTERGFRSNKTAVPDLRSSNRNKRQPPEQSTAQRKTETRTLAHQARESGLTPWLLDHWRLEGEICAVWGGCHKFRPKSTQSAGDAQAIFLGLRKSCLSYAPQ